MRGWLCGVLCGCVYAGHAGAATFCVGDVDSLVTALVNAGSNDQDNDILVQQGTYALKNAVFYDGNHGHALHVLGGYTAGCSAAGRTLAPANTVLDATAADGEFLFNTRGGDLTIEGLRWTKLNAPGTALALHQLDGFYGGKLTFRFNEVDHGKAGPVLVELNVLDEAEISTNLIHDNTATEAVVLNGYTLARGARVVHNTITANSGIGLHTNANWRLQPLALYNNILYGNAGAGLHVSKSPVFALNNTVSAALTDAAQTYATGSLGNSSTDPGLVPGTYALTGGSAAVNSGVPFADVIPAQDILGVKRWYGSVPDRGAYELVYSDLSSFTVTSASDSGSGTLRDAIHQANLTNGPSVITFAIGSVSCGPGGGPTVIWLLSALEDITVPLVIHGYSQPGAHPNTKAVGFDAQLCIGLSGGGTLDTALHIASGKPNARLDVSGIIFSWFKSNAIVLADGRGDYVHGNSFGVDAPGTGSVFPNGGNLLLTGNARAATIGGPAPADRNLFGAANGAVLGNGLNLSGKDSYSVVRGNYIGTDANGTGNRGNSGGGIQLLASQHNLIADNVIGANNVGVELVSSGLVAAAGNTIQGNNIGMGATGGVLGNAFAGVWLSAGATDNDIGSSDPNIGANGNRIANNDGPGVWIDSSAGTYNSVFANAIGTNTGLAIDLDAQGHLANDNLDADIGPNDLQNHPAITRAIRLSTGGLHVEGSIAAKANTPYYISIYANTTCANGGYGPANVFVGTFLSNVTDGAGHLSFNTDVGTILLPLSGNVAATASDATYNTSEISACIPYLPDEIFADGFDPPPP